MFWNPLESHHIGQSLDDLGAAPASFGTHQQALPRVFIDQVQHPHRPSVMGGSAHEVIAPDVVRPFWAQPHTRQLHAYDNRENVLKTIGSGRLTARPPSPEILEQIVEDSMSGSHEATMAYPIESILEDISAEVANINVSTVLLAGELDLVDS